MTWLGLAVIVLGLLGACLSIFHGSPADRANRIERFKRLRGASTKPRKKANHS